MIKQTIKRTDNIEDLTVYGEQLVISSSIIVTRLLDLSTVKHLVIKSNCIIQGLDLPEGLLTLSIGPGVQFENTVMVPKSIITLAVFDLGNWDYLNVPSDLMGIKELYKRRGQAFTLCMSLLSELKQDSAVDTETEKLNKAFQLLKMVTR